MPALLLLQFWKIPPKSLVVLKSFKCKHTKDYHKNHPRPFALFGNKHYLCASTFCRARQRCSGRVGKRLIHPYSQTFLRKTFIGVSVLDALKSGSFINWSQVWCNGRCSWICIFTPLALVVRHHAGGVYLHIHVGSAHCSSYFNGQSQSLNAWDEQEAV